MDAATLIKRFEGCRLDAYQDQVGVWTIGWGTTGAAIYPGLHWTQQQADSALNVRISQLQLHLGELVHVPLSANQMAALTSLAYNIGLGNFEKSHVLEKLNAGDYLGAAAAFGAWRKAGGEIVPGLEKRRAAEAAVFNTP